MSAHTPIATRFAVGDRVIVADRPAVGHCRSPWYLRGRVGVVVLVHGAYRDPERLAYHKPGQPMQVLYKVSFRQAELWPAPVAGGQLEAPREAPVAGGQPKAQPETPAHGQDHLEADIYEHWLERAP